MKKNKAKTTENGNGAAVAEPPAMPGEFKLVPLAKVRRDPNQPRKVFNETKLAELAESIKPRDCADCSATAGATCVRHGIEQPLVVQFVPGLKIEEPDMVRKEWQAVDGGGAVVFSGNETAVKKFADGKTEDFYQIIFGERRHRAAQLKELSFVPVIVRKVNGNDVFVKQFIENHQRENLSALEEAAAFDEQIRKRRESNPDFNAELLGAELGLSRGTVYNRLRLVRLHGPVRLALESGVIDATVAAEISVIPTPDAQEELLATLKNSLETGQPFSFREVREYIANNYVKQLADAPFDVKEPNYFPDGVHPESAMNPGPCTQCPNRSGNMKEMFPEIKNGNVCTAPSCFAEKCRQHAVKLAEEQRQKGNDVISRDDYVKARNQYVRAEDPILVGDRYLPVSKLMGKKGPKPTLVQHGTQFEEVFLKSAVIEAGKANGFDFTPPKPKESPKPTPKPKPAAADKAADEAKRKEQEERDRKEREKEASRLKLKEQTAVAALAELQKKIENRPINPKSETEFWRFLLSLQTFRGAMVFYNGHTTVWERRGYKGSPESVTDKLSYAELRALILEQVIVSEMDGPTHRDGRFAEELIDACKFAGIDLKKIEREIEDKNRELPGMPEKAPVKKKKK